MTKHARDSSISGFTLIELMVVVAIVGTLLLIALPAYQEQAAKVRRSDAQTALTGLAIAMERFYTEKTPSTYVGATVGFGGIYPNQAPLGSETKYYTLSINSQTASGFTLWAAPTGGHTGDDCGTFTLTHTGARGVTAGSRPSADCWE